MVVHPERGKYLKQLIGALLFATFAIGTIWLITIRDEAEFGVSSTATAEMALQATTEARATVRADRTQDAQLLMTAMMNMRQMPPRPTVHYVPMSTPPYYGGGSHQPSNQPYVSTWGIRQTSMAISDELNRQHEKRDGGP